MGRRAPGSLEWGDQSPTTRQIPVWSSRSWPVRATRASPGGGSGLGAKAGVTSVTSSGRRSSGVGPLLVVAGPGAGAGAGAWSGKLPPFFARA